MPFKRELTSLVSLVLLLPPLCVTSPAIGAGKALHVPTHSSLLLAAVELLTPKTESNKSKLGEVVQARPVPKRIRKALNNVDDYTGKRLMGAYNDGYRFFANLQAGYVMVKPSQPSALKSSLLSFIISYPNPRKNKSGKDYLSVITEGTFACDSQKFNVTYQQFQAGPFGADESVSAYEHKGPVYFRSVSPALGNFLFSVMCES
jgi:hypothetical protein